MPDPTKYNSQSDWMGDCVSTRQDEHPDEDNDQSVAICLSMWRDKSSKRVVHKAHASDETDGMDFILSDATVDRYGDSIIAEGFDLRNFSKNPIALFNHNADFPVGKWKNLHVEDGALRGKLELAPAGTSARIDEIRKLIECGVLRAVSVGFRPIESKPRSNKEAGELFIKSELVETSLVSVPANPNAIAIAKGLGISADTRSLVFGEHADKKTMGIVSRGLKGEHAEKPKSKGKTMSSLAQRIKDTQDRIVKFTDDLNEHMKSVDDANPTDEQTAITTEITKKISDQEKSLASLKAAEEKLAASAAANNEEPTGEIEEPKKGKEVIVQRGSTSFMDIRGPRPFAVPAKKITPADYIFRALTVQIKHARQKGAKTMIDVLKDTYGEDKGTYALMNVICRAATAPARTDVAGWAADLVTVAIGEFFGLLQPVAIYAKLAALGGRFTFGSSGVLSIPTRASTPTLGGAFVAQGAPIPVKQGAFTSITLTPKKVGVISTFTREIAEHSTPSIEQLIRDSIVEDTANAIDAVLMDNNPATTTRPAGLLNGISTLTNAAGTDITGVIADTKNIMNQLFAGTNGNVRTPVWLTTPGIANSIALSSVSTGTVLPFKDEVSQGRFMSYPIITSTNVPTGYLILLDAADFITATGDTPRFEMSDTAVLHFEDTAPADITTAAVGTTVKSLWQTDSMGIRMLMDMNWAMRRTGMIYFFGNNLAWD